LQKGLDPADKAVRAANYCRNMRHDVEVIAHSCGVPHSRRFRRFHVRIVGPDGVSRLLSELDPTDDPADSSAIAARNLARSLEKIHGPTRKRMMPVAPRLHVSFSIMSKIGWLMALARPDLCDPAP
jgi:hypothetical protein